MALGRSERRYLGIDLGFTGVKLVELKDAGGTPELVTYALAEYPAAETAEGSGVADTQIAATVRAALSAANTSTRKTYSALGTHETFTSLLSLPSLKGKELKEAITREAAKVLPLPIDKMTLDPQPIHTDSAADGQQILLVAAPNELVSRVDSIFRQAKLSLLGLETESFALIRALVGHDPTPVVIVDFGGATVDILIVDKGVPVLTRSLQVGGGALTAAFQTQLGVDMKEAEQLKRDVGMANAVGEKMPASLESLLVPVVNEIRHTIGQYHTRRHNSVEKIILSGGTAMLVGFAEHVESALSLPTHVGNPWARVRHPKELSGVLEESSARFAVAVGLALRYFTPAK